MRGGHYANTVLQFQTTSTAGPDPENATAGTGDGFASFLLGVGSGNDNTGFNKFPATDKHMLGWYLQDDWKATSKLTLNLGLRYEIQTAPVDRTNAQEGDFNFTATNPISAWRLALIIPASSYSIPAAIEVFTMRLTPTLRPESESHISYATSSSCAVAMAYSSFPTTMARARTPAFRRVHPGSRVSIADSIPLPL